MEKMLMCPPESQNKGRGERSGRWEFDSFEFLPGVFGSAVVEYDAIAKRIKSEDRESSSLFSSPYEMEVFGERVTNLFIFNDDGDNIDLDENSDRASREMILLAWRNQHSEVMAFEMGLL